MEGNNVQVITLTTTSSSPESASSTSHILNTSASSLISANYSNNSNLLGQDSSGSFSASMNEDLSDECKRKKFKSCSSEAPKIISKFKPSEEKLEERLHNVLCCAVCLELPLTTIYQCSKGHLICISCFHHLMADSKLKEDQATCASCRCVISRDTVYRNLAVEKAIRELPVSCQHCNKVLTRMQLTPHSTECEERPVSCYYNRIGCPWRGPAHERINHEENCLHPNKNGQEVLQYIETIDKKLKEDKILLDKIMNLMSTSERIHFQDSQFKPFRTDEYIHRLFFETSKFQAFDITKSHQLSNDNPGGYQFAIKARINDDQKDPTQSCERKMTYQLVLKSKISSPIKVHYFITSSPHDHDDAKLQTKTEIYSHEFNETNCETPYTLLPLISTGECNKLLSNRVINFRIWMFLGH